MIKVTDEAVDDLAAVLFVREWVPGDWKWEQYPEPNRWQELARKGLEAAVPHLQVQRAHGLRESVSDLRAWCEMQKEASGMEETEFSAGEFLAYKRVVVHLRKILTANPEAAAPAVPQPAGETACPSCRGERYRNSYCLDCGWRAVPQPVDREALRGLFRGPNACGIWLENLLDDREAGLIADAVLALLSPEETK